MIIKYEIEQFIKEIEAKLPKLEDKAYESAKDKIHVLNRVNIEFMDYEDLLRKASIRISESRIAWLEQKKLIITLQEKVKQLEFDLETLKERIE